MAKGIEYNRFGASGSVDNSGIIPRLHSTTVFTLCKTQRYKLSQLSVYFSGNDVYINHRIAGNFGREFFLPKPDVKYCGENSPDLFSRMPTDSDFI